MRKLSVLGLLVFWTVTPVWAQEEAAEAAVEATDVAEEVKKEKPWNADAGFNAMIVTGNSVNTTFGGDALASRKWEKDKLSLIGEGAYGRARDNSTDTTSTNTKNWRAELRYDRFLLERVSVFGFGHVGQDEPSGFAWRYGGAVGVAHDIWTTDPNFFKYEVGFDYTREQHVNPPNLNVYSARLFLQYKLKISEWATFQQDVENLFNFQVGKDVRINTFTALTMKLTKILAFRAGFELKYDNVPVPTFEKVDTTTRIGLVFDIL